MKEDDDLIHQGLFDTLFMTGRYQVGWIVGEKQPTTPGNRTYWRKMENSKHHYIFRVDVWSDSQKKFVLTRWYPEVGSTPYLETEYHENEDME